MHYLKLKLHLLADLAKFVLVLAVTLVAAVITAPALILWAVFKLARRHHDVGSAERSGSAQAVQPEAKRRTFVGRS